MPSWINDQIRARIDADNKSFENSFFNLSSVVIGRAQADAVRSARELTRNAVQEILKFYHASIMDVPDDITDPEDVMEYLLQPAGIMRRRVELPGTWWKNASGPMLGKTSEGAPVALLPHGLAGYAFVDPQSGERVKVGKDTVSRLQNEAYCFYNPLPLRKLNVMDLARYILLCVTRADILMFVAAMAAATLLGLISPYLNQLIFSAIIPAGNVNNILPIAGLMVGVTLSLTMTSIIRTLAGARIRSKVSMSVSAAAMSRMMSLSASFFKDWNAGELSSRLNSISSLTSLILSVIMDSGLTAVFSLVYIGQIGTFAPTLVAPALLIIGCMLVLSVLGTIAMQKRTQQFMLHDTKLNGLVFALFTGVQKIRLSGAEKRAFSKWADSYRESADLQYNPTLFLKLQPAISSVLSMAGSLLIFLIAGRTGVTTANYMAFIAAYGMVSGSIITLAGMVSSFASMKPNLKLASPILEAIPELGQQKQNVTRLSGLIELSNVSFQYNPDGPKILDDLSLRIRPGQYVAIVGKTGCGKSTLMRLLLGFEKPVSGAVYYDGKDLEKLDIKSVRRKIGVVLQNGKLFSGDIFANITVSAPWLTLDAAWEAARMSGMEEDINRMPMGMHTLISEGGGGISGGQRQRLLIARAIAPKPRILFFDEATSALDNITQRIVSDSLSKLKCTRIVIAHRLSTIKDCDRILVLDGGHVIEDGTYDSLIAKNGFFANLVKRQMVNQQ